MVLLIIGLVLAWYRIAEHRAEQVEVAWAGVPECTGAVVASHPEDDSLVGEEPWPAPLIEAERGMRCVITVEVRNGSGGSVHLQHALLPYVGPGGGAVIKVDTADDVDVWSTPQRDDQDTSRLLDVTLRAGETTTFDVPLVFREGGCSGGPDGGGSTRFEGFPTVVVTSLGRTLDRLALNDLVHTQMSASRGCVRMARG